MRILKYVPNGFLDKRMVFIYPWREGWSDEENKDIVLSLGSRR